MKYKYPIILVFVLCTSFSGWAQDSVTVNLNSAPFQELVRVIERQIPYRFFYRPDWTDSVFVTISAQQEPVIRVLERALEGTDLFMSINERNIYVTKERPLLTVLPDDFFDQGVTSENTVPFDYSAYEKQETTRKIAEEKTYFIGTRTNNMDGKATLTGTIKDIYTGETLVGAVIYNKETSTGASTDHFGHYSIALPKGKHVLEIRSVGMRTTYRHIILYNNGKLDIELEEAITPLKEVLVQADRDVKVASMQMGTEKLDIKTMKQIPLVLGEPDVMKVVLALPGVQSVGEGTVGLNVRGGATNQNLILFNDAVVYNPSHLFGFFSTFNPDVLKSAELYKSGITADYGGRLSSVLDVQAREGNLKKFTGSGGISPITGRLTLEGPIVKEKSSFIVGVRSTYSDWILKRIMNPDFKDSRASFYDITANINHKFNDTNSLQASGYVSNDYFKLSGDSSYNYSDRNTAIKWKRIINSRLFGMATATFSQYSYTMGAERNPVNAFRMGFNVKQFTFKTDFSYTLNDNHSLSAGVITTNYNLSPGTMSPHGGESLVAHNKLQKEQGQESALYIGDDYKVNDRLSFYLGLRYSLYQYLGKRDVFVYGNNEVRDINAVTDTVHYRAGKTISFYHGLEPRLAMRYLLSDNSSLKFSYNRTRQYIQMLSNTTAITPTDIWKLSDTYINPQIGDQVSIGYYKSLKGNIEISVETYYKAMINSLDYKDGAVLLLNHHIETDVLHAQGKAYGFEFLLKKPTGKVNGWVSYTYSRSFLRTKGNHSSETINNGKYYASNYDKPHAVNFISNYKFSRRFNFSLNLIYSTGRPITLPVAKYYLENANRIYYSERNAYRVPDYFRSDISLNIEGNHKIKKLAHSSWTFSLYNLTGRRNAYSVFFVSENNQIKGYKLSVFGQPIPTITYNFKF
ncbi:MAG: TonB-dependent receptor [Cyclobacteriaceae bacterium]|nr:TonB-dependent receptor [Cyclobacteriaceae bacterium]